MMVGDWWWTTGGSGDAVPRQVGCFVRLELVQEIRRDNVEYATDYLGQLDDVNEVLRLDLTLYEKIFTDGTQFLSVACFYGASNVAEAAISIGASVNCHDRQSRTPIHFAAAGGHRKLIRILTSNGANLFELDSQRRSFIHYATLFNRVDILNWAASMAVDLDAGSRMGNPIHIACRYGHLRIIELLARSEVDLNRPFAGRLPIFHLFDSCRLEALPLLVKGGLDLNKNVQGAWPPLFYAVRTGHANIVRQLLKFNADPNFRGKGQWTPLHVAAQSRCMKVVHELLLHGANPHTLTEFEQSPFSLARGNTPRDFKIEVPKFIREWLIDCFARAFIIGFAKDLLKEESFEIGMRSKSDDAREAHRDPPEPDV
jgi:ankyrin repeat protein